MTQDSMDGRRSWRTALLSLAILSVSYGVPLVIVVGLKSIQEALHTDREVLSVASALVWIGNGLGGILMGWLADRVGLRRIVTLGILAMAGGLVLSSLGSIWALYVGHGLLIGFLGNGALYAPLMIYVSRWFERRRGTALALIASGQYVAGVAWPTPMEIGIAHYGWQVTMLCFGIVVLALLPLVLLLRPAPEPLSAGPAVAGVLSGGRVLGLRPNTTMVLLCIASFCCCVPMALPASHLVAFCGDIGISAAHGALMLSVMLGCAFVSRQGWGLFAHRYGGLRIVLAGSAFQAAAIGAFMLTQNEAGLFAVAAGFGLGFSGIIPAYSLAVRNLFPSREASWRIPTVLFTAMSGMAFGSWFAGWIYDTVLSYTPAFGIGVAFNLMNLVLIGLLVSRMTTRTSRRLSVKPAE
ncbi:MAG: MFS transporter [Rhodopila sp.]